MEKILVIEDELKIARLVHDYLDEVGYEVVTAHDGQAGIVAFRQHRPDLVVLDLGLPGLDGLEVTKRVRALSEAPIVMLTARSEEADTIVGLELGADDYITKPFSPRELVARVRAVLRRSTHGSPTEIVRTGALEIDLARRGVSVNGHTADLTATEFDLLVTMARSPGRVFTRAQLGETMLGDQDPSYDRTIDSHIKNLRRKLEADPRKPKLIETVYGVGYRVTDG